MEGAIGRTPRASNAALIALWIAKIRGWATRVRDRRSPRRSPPVWSMSRVQALSAGATRERHRRPDHARSRGGRAPLLRMSRRDAVNGRVIGFSSMQKGFLRNTLYHITHLPANRNRSL